MDATRMRHIVEYIARVRECRPLQDKGEQDAASWLVERLLAEPPDAQRPGTVQVSFSS